VRASLSAIFQIWISEGPEGQDSWTLFHEIAKVLEEHKPRYVILENVGNFERHDGAEHGESFESADSARLPCSRNRACDKWRSGPTVSHHLGYPHKRDRFFIVASTREFLSTHSQGSANT